MINSKAFAKPKQRNSPTSRPIKRILAKSGLCSFDFATLRALTFVQVVPTKNFLHYDELAKVLFSLVSVLDARAFKEPPRVSPTSILILLSLAVQATLLSYVVAS